MPVTLKSRAGPADRSLVAEDRSAGGVRDQTGPEHQRALGDLGATRQRCTADNHGPSRTTFPLNELTSWT
jgi:hypothetical protein